MENKYTTVNIHQSVKEDLKILSDTHGVSIQGLVAELVVNLKTQRINWTPAQWKELKKDYPKDGGRLKKSWITITNKVKTALAEGPGTLQEIKKRTETLSLKQVEKVLTGDMAEEVKKLAGDRYSLKRRKAVKKS